MCIQYTYKFYNKSNSINFYNGFIIQSLKIDFSYFKRMIQSIIMKN